MMKAFILMIQFLTRLPVPVEIDMDKKTLSWGLFFFPFVGMLLGGISFGVYYIFGFINNDLAALGTVMAGVLTTGGLHLDGLSDTCDGFFSYRSRERILEIMKDSRVGSFGVIAIVFDLLAKYVLIRNIPQSSAAMFLVFILGASRLGAAMLTTFGKSARPGGLGDMFSSSSSKVYFTVSALIFTALGMFFGGLRFIIILAVMMISSLLIMRHSYGVIGGLTGDVYGASIELSEIAGLIALLVVMKWI